MKVLATNVVFMLFSSDDRDSLPPKRPWVKDVLRAIDHADAGVASAAVSSPPSDITNLFNDINSHLHKRSKL